MSTDHYPHPQYYPYPQQPGAAASQMAPGGYPAGAYPAATGYAAYPMPHQTAMQPGIYQAQPSSSFFNFTNDRFLKGLVIGAAATYLLTNESVQRTAIKGAVKAWTFVQGGVEEVKERFQDAEAELHATETEKEEAGA